MDEESTTVVDNPGTQEPTTTDQQTLTPEDNLTTTPTDDAAAGANDAGAEEGAPATQFDSDLDEWAVKTGRKTPESDSERALLQEIRDGQREFSRERQAKKASDDVNDAIRDAKPADNKQDDEDDDADPLVKEVEALKASNEEERALRMRSEYFSAQSVTEEESQMMATILKEKVDKGGKTAYDFWTNVDNLQDWHELAKARLANTRDTSAIEAEAARKERARIAKEAHASGPTRNATTTTTPKTGYDRAAYLRSDDD